MLVIRTSDGEVRWRRCRAGSAACRHARTLRHISRLIEEFGLEEVREPHVKHLRGPLWEMRMKGKGGISRAMYVTASGRRGARRSARMSKVGDLHRKWMKNSEYRRAHKALEPEFELARALIQARVHAGLTQEQLARRMDTSQSVIARLESGRVRPSTQTLERLAAATGTRLRIRFEPETARS